MTSPFWRAEENPLFWRAEEIKQEFSPGSLDDSLSGAPLVLLLTGRVENESEGQQIIKMFGGYGFARLQHARACDDWGVHYYHVTVYTTLEHRGSLEYLRKQVYKFGYLDLPKITPEMVEQFKHETSPLTPDIPGERVESQDSANNSIKGGPR